MKSKCCCLCRGLPLFFFILLIVSKIISNIFRCVLNSYLLRVILIFNKNKKMNLGGILSSFPFSDFNFLFGWRVSSFLRESGKFASPSSFSSWGQKRKCCYLCRGLLLFFFILLCWRLLMQISVFVLLDFLFVGWQFHFPDICNQGDTRTPCWPAGTASCWPNTGCQFSELLLLFSSVFRQHSSDWRSICGLKWHDINKIRWCPLRELCGRALRCFCIVEKCVNFN